jgi:hypothetical protein
MPWLMAIRGVTGDFVGTRANSSGAARTASMLLGSARPVPLQNHRGVSDLGIHELSYAARWYSLITPPSTLRR